MSSASTQTPPQQQIPNSIPEQTITPEMAKSLGIEFDPEKPKTLSEVFAAQFAKNLQFLGATQQQSAAEIAKMRKKVTDRLTGTNDSNLAPENKIKVDQIIQILSMYPQFIGPVQIQVATMVRRQIENDKLSAIYASVNPTDVLGLLDKQQDLLRASVPYKLWPENAGKTDEQIAAELAVRNGTSPPPQADPAAAPAT